MEQSDASGILDGLSPRKQVAVAFKVHPRTVHRWELEGLPTIRIGKQRLHSIERTRAWLLAREQSAGSEPPVRRGRPAKSLAGG